MVVSSMSMPSVGCAQLINAPRVTVGNTSVNVTFAGIVEAGLDQLNITLPGNLPAGDLPLRAVMTNGVATQTPVYLAVQ